MLPLGLSVAAATLIGNFLGAGYPTKARQVARVALLLACVESVVVAVLILATKHYVAKLFTSDPTVDAKAERLLPLIALFVIFDSYQGAMQGVYRGAGRQTLGAGITVVGYYLVVLPSAYILAFQVGWGLEGLWLGVTGASSRLHSVWPTHTRLPDSPCC